MTVDQDWWATVSLSDMTTEQWEQICDRCGKCCLIKLQEEDQEDPIIYYTDVACQYVNAKTCSCSVYSDRQTLVPDCVKLTQENLGAIQWMPPSCAYRLLFDGKALPDWHHLVSGNAESVHTHNESIRGRFVYETEVEDYEEHIVEWPID